jgi:hypothetical protein
LENEIIIGEKGKDYLALKKVHEIILNKEHLTLQGINIIKNLQSKS